MWWVDPSQQLKFTPCFPGTGKRMGKAKARKLISQNRDNLTNEGKNNRKISNAKAVTQHLPQAG